MRADGPVIGKLASKVEDIGIDAVDRAHGTSADGGPVIPGDRTRDPVIAGYIGVKAAEVAAEIVVVDRSPSSGGAVKAERGSVQGRVPEVIVAHPVELVASALADLVVEDAAGTVLGGKQRTAHLHFGDAVKNWRVDNVISHVRALRGAVHQRVRKRHRSVHRNAAYTWVG